MNSATHLLLFLTLLCSLQYLAVSSFEFQVGGDKGWTVPPPNDSKIYNDWASENRFRVGDSIRFKYRKDSVMEVTEQDYKKCNSTHPNFFSNNGNTVFKLDYSGSFNFISGASGHCEKGQRMIIKVLSPEEHDDKHRSGKSSGSIAAVLSMGVSKLVVVQFVLAYVCSCLFY